MGLSINDAVSDLTELKICGVVPFTKGTISGGNYRVITGDCLDKAIEIMRKYQKIEQIYKEWFSDAGRTSADAYVRIGEVLKNGNNRA